MWSTVVGKYKETYRTLPQLPEMKKLWGHGFYDGAISGVCEVNGEKCFFDMLEQFEDDEEDYPEDTDNMEPPWYRRFLVWKLTPEQFQALQERHLEFRRLVGAHTEYGADGKRLPRDYYGYIYDQYSVDEYYKRVAARHFPNVEPVSDEMIVGWYEIT